MKETNHIARIDGEENVVTYETEKIKNLIYTIRGKQVMLDSDVAMLYQYETKKINQTVKRNKERFPENFCFQLTESELECLRSQFATLEKNNRKLEITICDFKGNANERLKYTKCDLRRKSKCNFKFRNRMFKVTICDLKSRHKSKRAT